MSQSNSVVCTVLPSSPRPFNSYSQCRWNWPCLFLLGQANNHVKPRCQHTPPYLLPHLTTSLSLSPTPPTLRAGAIDAAATNFWFLGTSAEA